MNFTYAVEYQNKQTKTVTVLYSPDAQDAPGALPTVRVLHYKSTWTPEQLNAYILSQAPLSEWAEASSDGPIFQLGEVSATSEDVTSAVESMKPAKTLESVKALKLEWVDRKRMSVERQGVSYTFPGQLVDVIQLRDQRDLGNVSGLATAALSLKLQGVTDPVFPFRAESNVTYNLTPDQMLEMAQTVNAYISSLYQIGWGLKQVIEAASSIEEIEGIQWPS